MKNSKKIDFRFNLIIFSLLPLFHGCEEYSSRVHFQTTINSRTVNLQKYLGKSFKVIHYNDTLNYELKYDKKSEFSTITSNNLDTIFNGPVTRFRGMLLLNTPLDEGRFRINLLEISDDKIAGLNEFWRQQSLLKKNIRSEYFRSMILDSTDNKFIVKPEKKLAKKLLRIIANELKVDTLIIKQNEFIFDSSSIAEETTGIELKEIDIVEKIYPNPFQDHIRIDLSESGNYYVQIFDMNGNLINNQRKTGATIYFNNLDELPKGTYILRISGGGQPNLERKIIKL